jgi:hypothetical protein
MKQPQSFPLPYPFPDGRVWAAIRAGVVMNMVYMDHLPDDLEFSVFRQQSRATLAKEGEVWSGEVSGGRFVSKYESSDHRRKPCLTTD